MGHAGDCCEDVVQDERVYLKISISGLIRIGESIIVLRQPYHVPIVAGGGTGKTTAEKQTASTFLDAGWAFINVWGIGENQTYPYLWKYSAADIDQDESVNFGDLAISAENWLTEVAP